MSEGVPINSSSMQLVSLAHCSILNQYLLNEEVLSDYWYVLKKSDFQKHGVSAVPVGPGEGKEEDLKLHLVQEPLPILGWAVGHLRSSTLSHPLLMAGVPSWAELLSSLFAAPLDRQSWGAEFRANPLCAQCPARSWHRIGDLGFLTGEMNKGRVLEKPYWRVQP